MATPIPGNAARFRLSEVASICGGTLVGEDLEVRGVVTDSRAATRETLFVALRGERFDAHDFLPVAGPALVSKDAPAPHVRVEDTGAALLSLGRAHRERWGSSGGKKLVAITGSAGKTSTKELTAAALRGAGLAVNATRGNLNNLVGMPMTLLTLTDLDEVAVVEIGTSAPGEIGTLAEGCRPDVGVVTLVALAHTEGLGTVDAVFEEKTSLLRASAVKIVNGDDPRLATCSATHYGRAGDVRLVGWRFEGTRTVAEYEVGGVRLRASLQLVGEAAALNGAGALAVASALEVDLEAAARGMESLRPVPGRMCPRERRGRLILDDSYNANPSSTRLALDTAKALADARGEKLTAVLGDMKELGAQSRAAHAEVVAYAKERGALVAVGPEMAAVTDAVVDAPAALAKVGGAAGVVLVKGSRSMGLEHVVVGLLGEPTGEGAA